MQLPTHLVAAIAIDKLVEQSHLVNQLNRLPNWHFQRKGVLVELGLVASLLVVI